MARVRGIITRAGRGCAGTELHISSRDYPESRTKPRDFWLASTAVWYIRRLQTPHKKRDIKFCALWGFVGSCCPQVNEAQTFSWGCFSSLFVRDVFGRERNISITAGRVCAGTGFTVFHRAGEGYQNLAGTKPRSVLDVWPSASYSMNTMTVSGTGYISQRQ